MLELQAYATVPSWPLFYSFLFAVQTWYLPVVSQWQSLPLRNSNLGVGMMVHQVKALALQALVNKIKQKQQQQKQTNENERKVIKLMHSER